MGTIKRGRPSIGDPPHAPGIYRILNSKGKVDYIGESSDLARRKAEHFGSYGNFSEETHTFLWQRADGRSTSRTRREHEKRLIETLSPVLNQRSGGGGRPSGQK